MRTFWRWISIAFAAVFLLACTGCSTIRLGYNNADSLAYWWLDHYVDFEEPQETLVKRELRSLHAWHRTTQLNDYAQVLAHEQKRLQQPTVDRAQLNDDYAEIKKRAWALVDRALPAMADIALSLKPEQIARIESKFADNNDDYRKTYMDGDLEERQDKRYRKTLKQTEYWFGSLSAEQKKQLRAISDARPMNYELIMEERLQRQRDLIALLTKIRTERPEREAVQGWLKAYLVRFDRDLGGSSDSPVRQAFFDTYRDGTFRMVMSVVNFADAEQKAHAVRRVQHWIDDFNALAAAAS